MRPRFSLQDVLPTPVEKPKIDSLSRDLDFPFKQFFFISLKRNGRVVGRHVGVEEGESKTDRSRGQSSATLVTEDLRDMERREP